MVKSAKEKKAYQRAWYLLNRDKIQAKRKAYYIIHRERLAIINHGNYIAHLEERKLYQKKYRLEHLEERREKDRSHYASHKKEVADYQRIHRYNLYPGQFKTLLDKQGGVCAICQKNEWTGKGLGVDHDHKTGKLRGIICKNCNVALGAIRDDPKIAQAMINYLKVNG